MNIDDKMLSDLASQLGMGNNSNKGKSSSDMARETAQRFSGKSDAQILSEIKKVQQSLKKDKGAYKQQMDMVKSLSSMMSPEQRKKLDQLLRTLGE